MGDHGRSNNSGGEAALCPPEEVPITDGVPLDHPYRAEEAARAAQYVVRHRAQQHGARPVDVRRRTAAHRLQQQLSADVWATRGADPSGNAAGRHRPLSREAGDRPRRRARSCAGQAKWLEEHVAKLASGRSFSHVQNLRDGRKFLVTYQPLAEGGWVDIQEDITEKRRAEERIEWLARHDALTGVANRFHFRETFEAALKGRLQRSDSLAALDRPGPLQRGQRHARPSHRRRVAQGRRPAAARERTQDGFPGAARRR